MLGGSGIFAAMQELAMNRREQYAEYEIYVD
jgi:hypothetical protein